MSRQSKRLSEDLAVAVPGVNDVHNRLTSLPPIGPTKPAELEGSTCLSAPGASRGLPTFLSKNWHWTPEAANTSEAGILIDFNPKARHPWGDRLSQVTW